MRIVHLCSSNYYVDGWGYQENMLPEYHYKLGHDVYVVAPFNNFPPFVESAEKNVIIAKGKKYDCCGVHIRRIKYYLSTSNQSFAYIGLYRQLADIKPDLIFQHGVAGPMLIKSALFARLHKGVKLFVDNHADYINCSKNWLWFNLYIKGFERIVSQLCAPVISKAYGVTNLRCDYLHEVYGFKKDKIKLLPIGADSDALNSIILTKEQLKVKYGLSANDKVIISGGKMGKYKGTNNLLTAFVKLQVLFKNLKLVLFGKFEDVDTENLARNLDGVCIHGWCDRKKTLELLKMADIACWPVHHTTLIEDAIACSTPLVIRQTGNTEHLVNGNGVFVKTGAEDELIDAFQQIINNKNDFKKAAINKREEISYYTIAKEVIDDYNKSVIADR